ncbi:MAG: corrinoid protein [Thermodesulfobacteriota bacterium]
MNKEEILAALAAAVDRLDGPRAGDLVQAGLDAGVAPLLLINSGLSLGLNRLGERFQQEDAFIPDLIMGSNIVVAEIDRLKPLLEKDKIAAMSKGKFVIGTVAGDIHDLGKNLVKLILATAGWETIDLGNDVPNEKFVEAVIQHRPVWLGLSALLTTSMVGQKEVIDLLVEKGIRAQVRIMIGGSPCSQFWADQIGADAYGADPVEAVKKADAVR